MSEPGLELVRVHAEFGLGLGEGVPERVASDIRGEFGRGAIPGDELLNGTRAHPLPEPVDEDMVGVGHELLAAVQPGAQRLHADGFKLDANHDQPIEADDLPGLLAAFNSRDELWRDWQARDPAARWTEKWWFAETGAIEGEDWNLSASRYRPESREAADSASSENLAR